MKQKTKRLLAGLGIGLALGSSAMLTGCSSDITFNQKDLDNVISNVNTYLEDTQNNNSEYVRNTLNELIINGMNNSVGVNNIAYTVVQENYSNGIKGSTYTTTYKCNVEGKFIKEYISRTENNQTLVRYTEITEKQNTSDTSSQSTSVPTTKYDVENYVINWDNEKEYTKTEKSGNSSDIRNGDYVDYVDVYSSLILMLNDSNDLVMSDFVKSVDNDVVTYKCVGMNPEYAGSAVIGNISIAFKNGKVVKLETINTAYDQNLRYADGYSKITYTFDYENEAISFDKTGFNTDTSANN